MAPHHPIRRAGRLVVNAAMVATILLCAAWLVPGLLGYERYVITGGSMSGTFEKGSIAFEKQVRVADLEPGDVITYLPPPDSGVTTLVTHRITTIEPAEGGGLLYTTQGDANPDPDPWHFQLTDATQPVVEFTVPVAGYALIALADRDTRMLLIGGPAALVALLALAELIRAARPRRSGTEAPVQPSTPASSGPAAFVPRQAGCDPRAVVATGQPSG